MTASCLEELVGAVHAVVPGNRTLRNKDRTLFGRSLAEQLERGIQARFAGHSGVKSQTG